MSQTKTTKSKTPAVLSLILCAAFGLQMSCGTLFYSERKGQGSGKIDAGVAVMDSLLLLLFIVPGVVALIVDFNNDTIYEPGSGRR